MGEHYICDGGCKGVAEKPTVCGAESCAKFGQPLMECGCTDMQHDGAFEKSAEEPVEKDSSEGE